jgi:hypothetical protein
MKKIEIPNFILKIVSFITKKKYLFCNIRIWTLFATDNGTSPKPIFDDSQIKANIVENILAFAASQNLKPNFKEKNWFFGITRKGDFFFYTKDKETPTLEETNPHLN